MFILSRASSRFYRNTTSHPNLEAAAELKFSSDKVTGSPGQGRRANCTSPVREERPIRSSCIIKDSKEEEEEEEGGMRGGRVSSLFSLKSDLPFFVCITVSEQQQHCVLLSPGQNSV